MSKPARLTTVDPSVIDHRADRFKVPDCPVDLPTDAQAIIELLQSIGIAVCHNAPMDEFLSDEGASVEERLQDFVRQSVMTGVIKEARDFIGIAMNLYPKIAPVFAKAVATLNRILHRRSLSGFPIFRPEMKLGNRLLQHKIEIEGVMAALGPRTPQLQTESQTKDAQLTYEGTSASCGRAPHVTRIGDWPPDDGLHFRRLDIAYGSRVYRLTGMPHRLFETIATAKKNLHYDEIVERVWKSQDRNPEPVTVRGCLTRLKAALRDLKLDDLANRIEVKDGYWSFLD